MRCLIFGALPVARLPFAVKNDDFVIAADKGLATAKVLGVQPDLIVGDFDSLGYAPNTENVVRLNVLKDDTDVGYAINLAFARGYRDFHVFGAVGGKLDHTIANIQLAADLAAKGASCMFYGASERFAVIENGAIALPAKNAGRVSVFSLAPRSEGVSIRGLSYGCDDAAITDRFPIGVSNAFIGNEAEISVKDGRLLIVWEEAL